MQFVIDQKVQCVNVEPLKGNDVAPPLTKGKEYKIQDITIDSKGNQHLDVGLDSKYNWIKSYETGEKLPGGEETHWCHPSRFTEI